MACAETDGVYLWFTGKTIHYVDPALLTRDIIALKYLDLQGNGIKTFVGNHSRFAKDIRVEVRSYSAKERTAHRTTIRQEYDGSGNVSSVVSDSSTVSLTQQNFGNPGSSIIGTTTRMNADGTTSVATSSGTSLSTGGAQSSGYLTQPTDTSTEHYVYKRPNLSKAQCDALALQLWKQLSAHEYRATFSFTVTPKILADLSITSKYRISNLPWASFSQDYIALRLSESYDMNSGWMVSPVAINHKLPYGV
jgi:YD repeat-containing protein